MVDGPLSNSPLTALRALPWDTNLYSLVANLPVCATCLHQVPYAGLSARVAVFWGALALWPTAHHPHTYPNTCFPARSMPRSPLDPYRLSRPSLPLPLPRGFTPMSGAVAPQAVMAMLNDLFSRFDALLDLYGVRKVGASARYQLGASSIYGASTTFTVLHKVPQLHSSDAGIPAHLHTSGPYVLLPPAYYAEADAVSRMYQVYYTKNSRFLVPAFEVSQEHKEDCACRCKCSGQV